RIPPCPAASTANARFAKESGEHDGPGVVQSIDAPSLPLPPARRGRALSLDRERCSFLYVVAWGMRSPHEATAEASRPNSLHSKNVQGRAMSPIKFVSDQSHMHPIVRLSWQVGVSAAVRLVLWRRTPGQGRIDHIARRIQTCQGTAGR